MFHGSFVEKMGSVDVLSFSVDVVARALLVAVRDLCREVRELRDEVHAVLVHHTLQRAVNLHTQPQPRSNENRDFIFEPGC